METGSLVSLEQMKKGKCVSLNFLFLKRNKATVLLLVPKVPELAADELALIGEPFKKLSPQGPRHWVVF